MSRRWTDEELAALRESVTYEGFAHRTGGSRSYDAWDAKRRRDVPPPKGFLRRFLERLVG